MRSAGLALLGTSVCLACASPPRPVFVEPAPIELLPRCEPKYEGVAAPRIRFEREPVVTVSELPGGARSLGVASPALPFESLAFGVPTRHSEARLAAALLRAGETAPEPKRLREDARALGAHFEARAESGWLWLELHFPPAARREAIALFDRWLQIREPEPAAFERIRRGDVIATLGEQASATVQAARLFERIHPSGPRTPPTPEEPPTPSSVSDLLRQVLQPRGAIFVHTHAGNAAAAVVPTFWSERIGAWPHPARQDPGRSVAEPPVQRLATDARSIHLVDRPGSAQVELLVGFPGVEASHEDAPALEMLASLLGSDVGGRLFRDLRERRGLAYIINAAHAEHRFAVSTRSRPERAIALLAGIEAHLRALTEVPLEPCEVRMLLDRMTGETTLEADSGQALARRLRAELARGEPIEPRVARVEAFHAAAETLDMTAIRYLSGAPTVVLVGDAEVLAPMIANALPDRTLRRYGADLEPD